MSMFPFEDLRQFLAALEEAGELLKIDAEVDWNVEAGAIVRRCAELGTPAPFFQKIKGYPEGFNKMVGGPLAGSSKGPFRRCAIALGLDPDIHPSELIDEFTRRYNNPIKPLIVETGPCKENILKGNDVDVLKFPAPMIHKGDGGRYMCTWHADITKDIDSEWVNWGMYRLHVLTRRKMSLQIEAWRHGGTMFYQKYEPRDVVMPIAVAIGMDPLCTISASTDAHAGVSEVDIAGGLRQEPVQLVKCETNDLYVPATSEIVLEGHIVPGERIEEGPHGEYTGYRVSERSNRERLLVRVDAITFRNNPILPMSCMGMPVDDSQSIASLTQSAALLQEVRSRDISVKGLYVPPSAPWGSVIVSLKKPYAQITHEIASLIWGHPVGRMVHYVIFLEDTADPYDPASVLHEISFKCHPIRGIRQFDVAAASPLDPYLTAYERHFMIGASAILDCTAPVDWPFPPIESRFTNPTLYPEEIQAKVLTRWKEYGYE